MIKIDNCSVNERNQTFLFSAVRQVPKKLHCTCFLKTGRRQKNMCVLCEFDNRAWSNARYVLLEGKLQISLQALTVYKPKNKRSTKTFSKAVLTYNGKCHLFVQGEFFVPVQSGYSRRRSYTM